MIEFYFLIVLIIFLLFAGYIAAFVASIEADKRPPNADAKLTPTLKNMARLTLVCTGETRTKYRLSSDYGEVWLRKKLCLRHSEYDFEVPQKTACDFSLDMGAT